MANPNTRQKLIDYCLRALGHPVIEINVDDDQLEDRVDEAIQYYQEYHGDAVCRNLRKHKVTNSSLVVDSTGNIAITVGDIIEDATTGAKAKVKTISGDDVSARTITYDNVTTTGLKFNAGNDITINSETHPIVGTPVQGDIELGYIQVPGSANILSINNVFNVSNSQTNSIFSVDYQIHLNDIFDLSAAHGGIVNYEMTKQYLSLIDRNINGMYEMIEWSRHKNRVSFHSDTLSKLLNQFVILDGYEAINPETYTDVYNDAFLKKYTTALFKRQWGLNLIKFEGVVLPGGVTLNGRQIFDDAKEEIQQLEETMQLKHEMPPLDFIG